MVFRAFAVLLMALAASQASAQDLDLVNATLVDGTGVEPRPGITVSVRGGSGSRVSRKSPSRASHSS